MKKRRYLSLFMAFTLLLGMLSVSAFAADTGENMLDDPEFCQEIGEDGPWRLEENVAKAFRVPGLLPGYSGFSAALEFSEDSLIDSLMQECTGVAEDGYYVLSAYVKGSVDSMAAVCLLNGKGGRAELVTTEWTKISYVGYLRAGQPFTAQLRAGTSEGPGTVYFACPELTPWEDPNNPDTPSYGNLLKNPGFESALVNWNVKGNSTGVTVDNYIMRSGQRSLALNCPNDAGRGYVEQTVPVEQWGTYTFSAYLKNRAAVSGSGQLLLFVQAKDAGGNTVASNYKMASASGSVWTQASCRLSVPDTAKTLTVQIQIGNGFGAYNVDDVSLTYAK